MAIKSEDTQDFSKRFEFEVACSSCSHPDQSFAEICQRIELVTGFGDFSLGKTTEPRTADSWDNFEDKWF